MWTKHLIRYVYPTWLDTIITNNALLCEFTATLRQMAWKSTNTAWKTTQVKDENLQRRKSSFKMQAWEYSRREISTVNISCPKYEKSEQMNMVNKFFQQPQKHVIIFKTVTN